MRYQKGLRALGVYFIDLFLSIYTGFSGWPLLKNAIFFNKAGYLTLVHPEQFFERLSLGIGITAYQDAIMPRLDGPHCRYSDPTEPSQCAHFEIIR